MVRVPGTVTLTLLPSRTPFGVVIETLLKPPLEIAPAATRVTPTAVVACISGTVILVVSADVV